MTDLKFFLAIAALALCLSAPAGAASSDVQASNSALLSRERNQVEAIEAEAEYKQGKTYYNQGKSSKQPELAKQAYEKAMVSFRRAADRGKAQALVMIAVMYSEGDGVTQNYDEATKWYNEAAKRSKEEAEMNLHTLYANGKGLFQDYVQAYLKYTLSASAKN